MPIDIAKIASTTISFTDTIGRLAAIGEKSIKVLDIIAPFIPIPYVAAIVHALDVAAPYVTRVAQAAPLVEKAIMAGVPIAEAIQQHGPDLFDNLKQVFAIATNADPTRPADASPMSAAEVSNEQAFHFAGKVIFGRPWTDDEYQRGWIRAQGEYY